MDEKEAYSPFPGCTIIPMNKDNIKSLMILKNWSTDTMDPYQPPEQRKIFLRGQIYNDYRGRFADGDWIHTSSIKEVVGDIVLTHSGSIYILEEPNEDFVEWCKEHNAYVPTKEQPIRMRK